MDNLIKYVDNTNIARKLIIDQIGTLQKSLKQFLDLMAYIRTVKVAYGGDNFRI